ncbi:MULTISPECIES: bifunctional metallophosphatase/5'-nucleotidase [Staphylococcus]|uniref:bifunctional metallophosphatase/5'-nucleotidase n=1 Tax=Staphylococcus TaxID=1279 RepID=UPI00076B27CB|nr:MULTISPECIES: bifunctional UDP-sugar hydrolase/5'-nucleotidase [Staphylococcus]AMG62768.1 bifunctional metallophosphatase/5'-nucleotidase [Staphylococcus lugdunensis]ARB78157.1 bifunctional metallophosphatase/5'-nucleotidase [Staphylococcus lugdunensis]ARJ19279.1 bifunctional metallophosphatase/5'-nucleotidase [Staphylococcus lugdunensis]MBM7133150.1 bifunctional metallophosphatase/5'-nucleotidase [Staphylococcus lugdunensis]MCH8641543.1 bifunctional metallophosphatase/5'-nucleotidase [Stap
MEKNERISVDVITTTDMHSQFLNGNYGSNIYRAGQYVKDIRKRNKHVLLLDSGGSLAGSLPAYYYAIVAPYKRHPMIKLMNAMQYDASGISSDEFKFGLSFLTRSVSLARFPWLSANIEYNMTREPYFSTPYVIKQYQDVRIGIIGLTADGLMKNEYAEMEPDVKIEKTLLSAKRWIRYIHETEKIDFLIVIYHGGLDKISQTTNSRHSENANEAEKLIREMGVIDLIITAHQHQTVIGKDNETVYVQAGQNAEELVHINIQFKKRTNSYEIEHVNAEAINLNQHNEDEALLKLTYYDRKAVTHWSNEIISETSCSLQVNSLEDMVAGSHHFTQLLHDSLRYAFNNNITCVNVPRNGEQGLKQQIQNKDIYEAYPHPDKPIDITLLGQQIKDILEYSYAHLEIEDDHLKQTVIDETLCTQWQGFNYEVNMKKPPFQRVTIKGIDLNGSYRVTMTDYCFRNYQFIIGDVIVNRDSFEYPMSFIMTKLLNTHDYRPQIKNNFIVNS